MGMRMVKTKDTNLISKIESIKVNGDNYPLIYKSKNGEQFYELDYSTIDQLSDSEKKLLTFTFWDEVMTLQAL